MEIKTTTRRWGDSIAVIIPSDVAKREKIGIDEEIVVTVEKPRPKAGVMWGFLKDWKRSAQEIKDDARAGWESASDRRRWRK